MVKFKLQLEVVRVETQAVWLRRADSRSYYGTEGICVPGHTLMIKAALVSECPFFQLRLMKKWLVQRSK